MCKIIPFLIFYYAKNNVVQPFRLVYKSQAGSLGYNAHLIMRNGIKQRLIMKNSSFSIVSSFVAFLIPSIILSIPVTYFVIPFVAIYYMLKYRGRPLNPGSISGVIGSIGMIISGLLVKIFFITAFMGKSCWGMAIGCLAVLFIFTIGIILAEMIILMVFLYWIAVFNARMIAHVYRGDKIVFHMI